jgi:4-hydroxy-3-methylbut-2-en-1-yl diphosphate reductase
MRDRYGDAELTSRYRAFDTICSATQDRQDAVLRLLAEEALDLAIVIGGYNSSNTCNLARICAGRLPTFHVAEPSCLLSPDAIKHRPVGEKDEIRQEGWLPAQGALRIGLTSGASTPDNIVGRVIELLDAYVNGPDGR